MIDAENKVKIEVFMDTDKLKIFVLSGLIYITLKENSCGTGFCIIHTESGQKEAMQELNMGENKINHSFSNGVYFISLSIGPEMISKKIVI
ncbi:MAG: T9SS type A sorting domain-containing protein [Bacteroidales bacterium]|nr:T9SS type A sorting domain-containing protein [Bacteroidales bacterium]